MTSEEMMSTNTGYTVGMQQAHVNNNNGKEKERGGDTLSAYVQELNDSRGSNDVVIGNGDNNFLIGDAYLMNNSRGGNDHLSVGVEGVGINYLKGDADTMTNSRGGNDVLKGGLAGINRLYGDAFDMIDSVGGNDKIIGGDGAGLNILYGDAMNIYGVSSGGNDLLRGGDGAGENILYGDADMNMEGQFSCGNDRLISGTAKDKMWGDISRSYLFGDLLDLTQVTTGHDVFVFAANNGEDIIYDFRHGEDKIELQGLAVDSFAALSAGGHLSVSGADSVITFCSNTITVVGVTALAAEDFLFA